TPTPEPTPAPTEEPAETPAPAASADDQYYRQEGDPAEVITVDPVSGYWEYKTDTLSIVINRFVTTYTTLQEQTFPQVYFVAELRMREVNAFRTAQAAERRNGTAAILPYRLARENNGVLLITGDNLIMNDEEYKGILIRGGKYFGDFGYADTMAMYPDMTLRIFRPGETTAEELMADGVRDAISFGPTLMRDGVLLEGVDRFRDLGDERNPRVGLGMVEPGHFIIIVADGRQKNDYSHGMSLSRFAELFVDYGCRDVYNLDGGVSACMVFMGEQLNRHADRTDATTKGYTQSFQRRIPDGLVWGYSEQVPSVDDPVYNSGTNKDGQNLLPTPTPAAAP
ncbi:MAG: phosphodiester glycosidase family protein, partial [Clostridia bacterium]|nr:phosphodiester glycosidase family protein [Clostridia bacterium]